MPTLTLPAPHLPQPMTPIVGRERDVTALISLIQHDARLVTLTGPGGSGKTRLAIHVATELAGAFAQRIWFVSLAAVRDPALVPSSIAQALGVRETADQPVATTLSRFVGDRPALLVLDNLEQVVDAAPFLSELLQTCPSLSLLATSRRPLRLYGEHDYLVPPLPLPDLAHLPPVEQLARNDAVRLFVDRARAAAGFTLTAANATAVAGICARLDGLPLALELAAARIRLLPPHALLARLTRGLPVLVDGPRDAPARHQTLRDTIAWSYDLLAPADQRLFQQLSVFAGGWTLDAAQAIGDPDLAVLDGIARLLDHSLVLQLAAPDDTPRYGMLETVREFAAEQLDAGGDNGPVRLRHARWFQALALRAAEARPVQLRRQCWAQLEREQDNLRAALASLLAQDQVAGMVELALALERFWDDRGQYAEARHWFEQVLPRTGTLPAPLAAHLCDTYGYFVREQGQFDQAELIFEQALAFARAARDQLAISSALNRLGWTAVYRGQTDRATALLEESLALARTTGHDPAIANRLSNLSLVRMGQGRVEEARALIEESVAIARRCDDPELNERLMFQGLLSLVTGDLDRAAALGAESLDLARDQGDDALAEAYALLAGVALERGQYAQAHAWFTESLVRAYAMSAQVGLAEVIEGIASVHAEGGDAALAASLLAVADRQRHALDMPVPHIRRPRHERTLAAARAALNADDFDHAWAAGLALTLDDAVAAARQSFEPRRPESPDASHPLTPRELEVLRLVSEGLSDAEVAEQLYLARRTVNTHLTSIYTKLGVSSRVAATRWAITHGLA